MAHLVTFLKRDRNLVVALTVPSYIYAGIIVAILAVIVVGCFMCHRSRRRLRMRMLEENGLGLADLSKGRVAKQKPDFWDVHISSLKGIEVQADACDWKEIMPLSLMNRPIDSLQGRPAAPLISTKRYSSVSDDLRIDDLRKYQVAVLISMPLSTTMKDPESGEPCKIQEYEFGLANVVCMEAEDES